MTDGTAPPPEDGRAAVDTALAQLTALDTLPVADHPAVYAAVHESLDALLRAGAQSGGLPRSLPA